MEHITEDVVGKVVIGPGGEEIGTVTAVEADRAILDAGTGVAADMEAGLADADDESLSITADQIETVGDERIHLGSLD